MSTLRELTEQLLDDPNAADALALADEYIDQHQRLGESFVLPAQYRHVKPLIEVYSGKLGQFVTYLRAMCDSVERGSQQYEKLYALYRTVNTRYVQQVRRARISQAVAWFERTHPEATTLEKHAWIRRLEQTWAKRRLKWLEDHRKSEPEKRLTIDRREEVLREFWAIIDEETRSGSLPPK